MVRNLYFTRITKFVACLLRIEFKSCLSVAAESKCKNNCDASYSGDVLHSTVATQRSRLASKHKRETLFEIRTIFTFCKIGILNVQIFQRQETLVLCLHYKIKHNFFQLKIL